MSTHRLYFDNIHRLRGILQEQRNCKVTLDEAFEYFSGPDYKNELDPKTSWSISISPAGVLLFVLIFFALLLTG